MYRRPRNIIEALVRDFAQSLLQHGYRSCYIGENVDQHSRLSGWIIPDPCNADNACNLASHANLRAGDFRARYRSHDGPWQRFKGLMPSFAEAMVFGSASVIFCAGSGTRSRRLNSE